eukprot:symbB.v1.2.037787.t1/scaffold5677.1/size24669/1
MEVDGLHGMAWFISILPPSTAGADQIIRVVGDSREYARQLILEKIEDLKVQVRQPGMPTGYSPGMPVAGLPGMGMPGMGAPMGTAPMPGRSKARPPMPMMGMQQPMMPPPMPPSMPLRPAPPAQGALPYGPSSGSPYMHRPGPPGCGCYGGAPSEMDMRPSLGGCGLPAMGSTTGASCMGGPPGCMGGCGLSAPSLGSPMGQMPPGTAPGPGCMGQPGPPGLGMSMGMSSMGSMGMGPGPPGGLGPPSPPGPPGPPVGFPQL